LGLGSLVLERHRITSAGRNEKNKPKDLRPKA
jgi:hypothetical protein